MKSKFAGILINNLGLPPNESRIYEVLLEKGPLAAAAIAKFSDISRSNVYAALENLKKKGLVEPGKKTTKKVFQATSPDNLESLIAAQETILRQNKQSLYSALKDLKSLYHITTKKPSVRYYEGMEGLQKIYEDILREGEDILLLRSVYDDQHPKIGKTVLRQIKLQAKAGIHTKAITPYVKDTPSTILKHDKEHLVERRIIPKGKLILPAQIIIYKNKVAITDMKDSFISSLIENPNIAKTFRELFQYIWELAAPEHAKIYEEIMTKNKR